MGKYDNLSKEELLKIVEKQDEELRRKKYGLVWEKEREPEKVVIECAKNLPVLDAVDDKTITTDATDDNILIEGDNYHALSVLCYTHKEKIDVIYIDPPYNTGNKDFVYNDRYVDKDDKYRHSKWLNFMEKRLLLAKKLLKETGAIFISIDDNEMAQLKLLCDSVFGEENHIGTLIWEKKKKGSFLSGLITNIKEYVLVYSKESAKFSGLIGEITGKTETYPCVNPGNNIGIRVFPKGIVSKYKQKNFTKKAGETISAGNMSLELLSDLIVQNGILAEDVEVKSEWRYSQDAIDEYARKGELYLTNKLYFRRVVNDERFKRLKDILPRVEYEEIFELQNELINELLEDGLDSKDVFELRSKIDKMLNQNNFDFDENNLFADGWASNEDGDDELRDFFGNKFFEYPKPSKLISKLLASVRNKNALILDFMAGSGTTAQAVLQLNKKDGGNRRFILCTNNENGICENVTYPRLSKVINGYQKRGDGEWVEGLGGNLRYFKTSLLPKSKSPKQLKAQLTKQCVEMLCVKENIFNAHKQTKSYKLFISNDGSRLLGVYFDTSMAAFEGFLDELRGFGGQKAVYVFSDSGKVDGSLFAGVKNCRIEEIPQKILDVYKRLVKLNVPSDPETIFIDFEKARKRVFEEKDKDDGARVLRVVLEKVMEKIASQSGVNINDFGELSRLNDHLKQKDIITKVLWEENKTYIAIGNSASHGDYDEYEMKQVENFYKHIQNLIDKYIG